ncbi:hypothetical protein DNX69_14705 [Rhodopseudomonas palustris]|uniref:Uncharacterized protein n=1 Tax=Rhodopseudomonas palustris TaxID=1076 RepID=A0A323UCM6_RHOPL|nr:hypothetical protein DNX69_14705 [Rhodopseudomonas palustris]
MFDISAAFQFQSDGPSQRRAITAHAVAATSEMISAIAILFRLQQPTSDQGRTGMEIKRSAQWRTRRIDRSMSAATTIEKRMSRHGGEFDRKIGRFE